MELLTCPSCGCSVQTADALLGRRVRCFACKHTFLATPERIAPPRPPSGRSGDSARQLGRPRAEEEDFDSGERGPFCPGCGRRIGWRDWNCPFCGEELEP